MLKETVKSNLVNLLEKMAMPDLQRYPYKLCLITYKLDINVFVY